MTATTETTDDIPQPAEKKKIYNLHNNIFEEKGHFKVQNPPKRRTTATSNIALRGNFYPVFEETEGDHGMMCEVEGTIPECLADSQYVRTGEGMLHGVYFSSVQGPDGRKVIQPRYMNRWVRSQALELANKHGHIVPSVSVLLSPEYGVWAALKNYLFYGIKGFWRGLKDMGNGSTSLTFFQSRVLALQEAGLPYEIEVPTLDTIGQYYFEKTDAENFSQKGRALLKQVVTAHPKYDPKTGEIIFFRYGTPTDFSYSVVAADGTKTVWEEHIPGQKPQMVLMHDFAVTDTYSIFIDAGPRVDMPNNLYKGLPVMGMDPSQPSRYAIIPRYFKKGRDEVRWFEAAACSILHTANAWDIKDAEGKVVAIHMLACRAERFPNDLNATQKMSDGVESQKYTEPGSDEYSKRQPEAMYLSLYKFDLIEGTVEHTTICPIITEFPTMNYDWFLRPESRYVYMASIQEATPGHMSKLHGIVKADVHAALELQRELREAGKLQGTELGIENLARLQREHGQYYRFPGQFKGGEATFVSRGVDGQSQEDLAEDDGFLLVYVYDESQLDPETQLTIKEETEQVTELWIFDAQNIEQGPVAKIKIPRRVPYGFHGFHVRKSHIQENRELQHKMGRLSE
ncbi:hypothetical protein DFQ27_007138 [Actinomortierella ambigua]|uniref:Carotenoid oxygenase n=1 Tax=Actinomortierella ambigua TaxID=1343610 RepID=A0A9P6UC04_9FUNG|nr:hypothetical protein DFQ27_007138 [Actinomortierella ambigua]